MAFQSTRKTKLAVVQESVEGTPVAPSDGTTFILPQDGGFELTPNFDTVENAELSGIIGNSAPIQGLEAPEATISHYFRHSGVEGTAFDGALLLKSLMGTQTINSSERVTQAGSSVSNIKLAAGASDFSRGKAMLIKDSINGFSIRNTGDYSGSDVPIYQNVSVAPATGVATGKCINWTPNDDGIPVSIWDYRADGGAIQMISGAKATSCSISIPAADAINAEFGFSGQKFYFNPIEIAAASKYIDFKIDAGAEISAVLTEKFYRDPHELAAEIQAKMDALTAATITCVYSNTTGKFTITATAATSLDLLWLTGTNTATSAKTKLGFANTDDTGSLTYSSDTALSWIAPYTPAIDNTSFLIAKHHEMIIGSGSDITCVPASDVSFSIDKDPVDVLAICAESGKASTLFNGRTVTVEISGYLSQHDASKFKAYRANDTVMFTYNGGTKSSGNWVAGTCFNLFIENAKIINFSLGDTDGIVAMNLTLQAFVTNSQPEVFINML